MLIHGRAKYPKFDLMSFEKEEEYIDEYAEGEFIELDTFCWEQGATRLTDFDAKGNFRRENGNPFPMQTDHHQHSQLRAKMLHAPRLDVPGS